MTSDHDLLYHEHAMTQALSISATRNGFVADLTDDDALFVLRTLNMDPPEGVTRGACEVTRWSGPKNGFCIRHLGSLTVKVEIDCSNQEVGWA